jgi:hypothetical protein
MKTIKKEFLGHTFSYKTEVDEEGRALWTKDIDHKFSKWLFELREVNRELFKVQYSITKNAHKVLEKLKNELGVFDESLIIRAITITFINFIDTKSGKKVLKKLSEYKSNEDFSLLVKGDVLKKNLYFSHLGIRDVEAYSQLTGLPKSKVILNALYSVLLISINEDAEIKRFWEEEIVEKITTIVKAA